MSDAQRDEFKRHARMVMARQNASPDWKAEQIVEWLWSHRVVLCSHTEPAWDCEKSCPAFQAAMARALRAERRVNQLEHR